MNYQKAYGVLFNAITQAIDELEKSFTVSRELEHGIKILTQAQQKTEEMYIESGEETV